MEKNRNTKTATKRKKTNSLALKKLMKDFDSSHGNCQNLLLE